MVTRIAAKERVTRPSLRRYASLQQGGELLCHHWTAKIVALAFVTMQGKKKRVVLGCFHALRKDAFLEAFTHADQALTMAASSWLLVI